MGLFDLFNENKRKWLAVINSSKIPVEFKNIIKEFFLHDNISFELFSENQRAEETGGLDEWEDANSISIEPLKKISCTPTYRKHYANSTLNRGIKMPSWFYVAYPDVAYWFQQNDDQIVNEIGEQRIEKYFANEEIHPNFFRIIIDRYKIKNGSLECGR